MKKVEDYLPFYIGCEVEIVGHKNGILGAVGIANNKQVIIRWSDEDEWSYADVSEIKPILRKLDSMTEEELQECGNMVYDFSDDPYLNNHKWQDFEIGLAPEQFHWLLSKHFDLFGLIDEGIALDAMKTESTSE